MARGAEKAMDDYGREVVFRPPCDRQGPGNTPHMRGVKVGD